MLRTGKTFYFQEKPIKFVIQYQMISHENTHTSKIIQDKQILFMYVLMYTICMYMYACINSYCKKKPLIWKRARYVWEYLEGGKGKRK